jgi:hypothetical protein
VAQGASWAHWDQNCERTQGDHFKKYPVGILVGTFQKNSPLTCWVTTGRIASEVTKNSQWTCWVNAPLPSVFSDMPMSTTLLFEVHNTISGQRRSHHMILCANGPQTSTSGCKTSPSMMPRVWTTASLLRWFRNFISPHIAKSVEPTSRSTMSLGRGGETWKGY